MAFLRIKPVRKENKVHHYVYEVESYKDKGKVKQRTVRFLGKHVRLEKKLNKKFSLSRIKKHDSREALLKEIFAHNLLNYGFKQIKENEWRLRNIVADLNTLRVFHSQTERDVYINMNEKFFGSHTLSKALKSDSSDIVEFVKTIIDAGALDKEKKHDFKLLQLITEKFRPEAKMEESSFKDFAKEIGY